MRSYPIGVPSAAPEHDGLAQDEAARLGSLFSLTAEEAWTVRDGLRLSPYVRCALPWAELGHFVVPATHGGKDPGVAFGAWSTHAKGRHRKLSPKQIILQVIEWWQTHKVDRGLLLLDSHADPRQHLVVIDVDDPAYWPWVRQTFGDSGVVTWSGRDVTDGSEKPGHLFFKADGKVTGRNGHVGPPEALRWPDWPDDEPKSPKHWGTSQLDVKAAAGYVVAPGSTHKTGRRYSFSAPITQATLDALPAFDAELYETMCAATKGERRDRKNVRLKLPTLTPKARTSLEQNLREEIDEDTPITLANGIQGTLKALTAALAAGGRTLSAFCPEHHNTDTPAATVGIGYKGHPFLKCYGSCDATFGVPGKEPPHLGLKELGFEDHASPLRPEPAVVAYFDPGVRYASERRGATRRSPALVPYHSRFLDRAGLPVNERCGFTQLVETPDKRLVAVTRHCRQPTCHRCMARKLALQAEAIATLPLRHKDGRLGPAYCERTLYLGRIGETDAALSRYKRAFERGHKASKSNGVSQILPATTLDSGEETATQSMMQSTYDDSVHGYVIFDAFHPSRNNPYAAGRWVLATGPWGLDAPGVIEPGDQNAVAENDDTVGLIKLRATLFALMVATITVEQPGTTGVFTLGFNDDVPTTVPRVVGRIRHSRTICLDPQTIRDTDCTVATDEPIDMGLFRMACDADNVATRTKHEDAIDPNDMPVQVAIVSAAISDSSIRSRIIMRATGGDDLDGMTGAPDPDMEDALAALESGEVVGAPHGVEGAYGAPTPAIEAALDALCNGPESTEAKEAG